MNRAEFLRLSAGGVALLVVGPLCAQPIRARPVRIGFLAPGTAANPPPSLDAFRQGMRVLGYNEGRDILLDLRWVDNPTQREAMAKELLDARPDILVAIAAAVPAAHKLAGELPVVFGFSGDPVKAGFVASYARPGGPRTGMSWLQLELAGKRIDILKELKPGLKRVAIIANPEHPGETQERETSIDAARRQGVAMQYLTVKDLPELERAFVAIDRERAEAIVSFPDYFTVSQAARISELSLQRRLPLIGGWDTQADRGHLFSYGPNLRAAAGRLAYFVDRIIRGTRASELPVELPTIVEFVINLKTARAIGVAVPQSLLLRADKVIE